MDIRSHTMTQTSILEHKTGQWKQLREVTIFKTMGLEREIELKTIIEIMNFFIKCVL